MGRIQKMKMERAKRAFKEELFPTDKARAFYVDHAGNAMGFTIERADGHVLSYNGDSGRYEPFNVLPEDGAVNMPPYAYKDGKVCTVMQLVEEGTFVYDDLADILKQHNHRRYDNYPRAYVYPD